MINQIIDLDALKAIFPKGEANEMNFCLFSTSGVHGTYLTIEGLFKEGENYSDQITVVVIQPRIVSMIYGHIKVKKEDVEFLKKLRKSSWEAVELIGL